MAAPASHERRAHFRGRARPGRQLPVRLRRGDGAWHDATTRDVGVGGAFVVTPLPLAIGDELTIALHLPTTPRVFELAAVVRWVDARAGGGVGVQFGAVDVDVLLELNELFGALTSGP